MIVILVINNNIVVGNNMFVSLMDALYEEATEAGTKFGWIEKSSRRNDFTGWSSVHMVEHTGALCLEAFDLIGWSDA